MLRVLIEILLLLVLLVLLLLLLLQRWHGRLHGRLLLLLLLLLGITNVMAVLKSSAPPLGLETGRPSSFRCHTGDGREST